MTHTFTCHTISKGQAEGDVLVSTEPILFYHVDPATGIVTETGHCLEGKNIKGRIVVFPGGKGSSVVQADGLYKLEQHNNAPAGFIVQYLDTVLVSSAIIMEIPMVSKVDDAFYTHLNEGQRVKLDANQGLVHIL